MDLVALQMHTSPRPSIPQIPYSLELWGVLLQTPPKQPDSSAALALVPQKMLHPGQIGDMLKKCEQKAQCNWTLPSPQ